jgi:hypothetical protein
MAIESHKRIIHDWSTGELTSTDAGMTEDEEVGEINDPALPPSEP